jgi:hypothetical protein
MLFTKEVENADHDFPGLISCLAAPHHDLECPIEGVPVIPGQRGSRCGRQDAVTPAFAG